MIVILVLRALLLTFLLLSGCFGQQTSLMSFRSMMVSNQSFTVDITLKNIGSLSLCTLQCHQQTNPACQGIAYDDASQVCEIGRLTNYYEVAANGKYIYTTENPAKVPHLWIVGDSLADYSFDPTHSPKLSVSTSWLNGLSNLIGVPYKNGVLICGGINGSVLGTSCSYYQAGQAMPQTKAPMLKGRYQCGTTTVKGTVWMGGCTLSTNNNFDDTSELFDYAKDAWVAGPQMAFKAYGSCLTTMDSNDRKVLFAGGFNTGHALDTAAVFNWPTQTWTTVSSIPGGPRGYMACARITLGDGSTKVMVAGGQSNWTTIYTDVYSMDPATLQWKVEASIVAPRFWGVMVQVGSVVYYMGGLYTGWSGQNDVYQLALNGDPTAKWIANVTLQAGGIRYYGLLYNLPP